MLSIINKDKMYENLDELIYIEHFKREVDSEEAPYTMPSFTVLDGYALILSSSKQNKKQIQFNTEYVFKINLDKARIAGDLDWMNTLRICKFNEFRQNLKAVDYKIKGLNDSIDNIRNIADYEIVRRISEEHMERMLAFGVADYIEINKKSDINGYTDYYEKTVVAARKLLTAIELEQKDSLINELIKRMSVNYILFLSYTGFTDKLLDKVLSNKQKSGEDLCSPAHRLGLSYHNLYAVINNNA